MHNGIYHVSYKYNKQMQYCVYLLHMCYDVRDSTIKSKFPHSNKAYAFFLSCCKTAID
jgi:hypothetical protein